MKEIQRFALENIYCAPSQDKQYTFKLRQVTKKRFPVRRFAEVYGLAKNLPNTTDLFHVYVIGSINPHLLNLLRQRKEWFRDQWVNAEEDMNLRNFTIQIYNSLGLNFPRRFLYYSFTDENTLLFAYRVTERNRLAFDVESIEYIRFYSNIYYNSPDFSLSNITTGIRCELFEIQSNLDKVRAETRVNELKRNQGEVFVYVNGFHTKEVNLDVPNQSFLEILYDASVISKEVYPISELRTFMSEKDNTVKYLLFRDKIVDSIQYEDDIEVYISTQNEYFTRGLYFYRHKDLTIQNVTDKDFSLKSLYVNNLATELSSLTFGQINDKVLVVYTRKSQNLRPLIYSSLKLHELYKLPQDVERNVLTNMNYTIPELRASSLENSDYFKIASMQNIGNITTTLASSAVGYNGIKYYYAYTPTHLPNRSREVEVPFLYRDDSYAYEYDIYGKLIGKQTTEGPIYLTTSESVRHVEFIRGQTPIDFGRLYNHDETVPIVNEEFVILSANFSGIARITNWEDITNNTNLVSYQNRDVTFRESVGKKIKIMYLDEPLTVDLQLPLVDGILHFPIPILEDRGNGVQSHILDTPYSSIEVFLNGYRLHKDIDFIYQHNFITIYSKTRINYSELSQSIHIRAHGYTLDRTNINADEVSGFVSHGVLTRNLKYDLHEDKVLSIFIDGKLMNRANVRFAEDDNIVRTFDHLNGLPYSVAEHIVSIKEVTGESTLPLYSKNKETNKRISDLFKHVFKEPPVPSFNVIPERYTLYSPTVSKIIHDVLEGDISPALYMNPYDDSTIVQLLEDRYRILMLNDPVRRVQNETIVDVHPHIGNAIITLNLHQYRFITNVIRIITTNAKAKINISGYLAVTA